MQRRLMAALALAVVATATTACSSGPPTASAARRSTTTTTTDVPEPRAASTTAPSARPTGVSTPPGTRSTTAARGHRAGRSPGAGAPGTPAASPGAATPSGGGGGASGGGRPPTTTTRPGPVATTTAAPGAPSTTTPAALLAQLATGEDLGDGWGAAHLPAQPSPPGACRGALDAAAAANPHAQAGFLQAPSSDLTELVIQFPSADQASAGYHTVAAQFAGCGVTSQRVSVGLTSAAYSGTAGAPTPGGWLWLIGLKGSMIGVLTLSQPGAPPAPGELQPLAQAALAKLTG